ncbi:MOSC domain-containing protein [Shouchella sp. JSM 1781072]|uniref:MOSC domain-containing protein n=1 Tax=Bacillaceae TaxID=186817 RepID=UPI0020D1BF91|nr:MOSC domain-containing protein [Alkalihalobacillus sp. LMS6]UTR05840.1 MOSC domain-containing protein [Alkalihalobacillus sp. LMS6]
MERTIFSLSTGLPQEMQQAAMKKPLVTGIKKAKIERVYLTKDGFIGDGVGDKKNHGGLDRAVCFYPQEHYPQWEEELGRMLPNAAFGENLTVANMLEEAVFIGDIYKVGEAVIQITQGRIPCSTIDNYTQANTLLKRTIETGFTGYLARVLEEGNISSTSSIELLEEHPKKMSVLSCNQVYFANEDWHAMEDIASIEPLAADWKRRLAKRIDRLKQQR